MGRGEVMRELSERFFPETDYRPVRTWSEIVRELPASTRRAVNRVLRHGKRA